MKQAAWPSDRNPQASLIMNGALAGSLAITAPYAFAEPWDAIILGVVGGIIVVMGVILLKKPKIDNPVGAVPVYGLNRFCSTLSIGMFGKKALDVANNGLLYSGD